MTLLAGVLLASVLGSVHCAAMCGAFVCAYAGQRGPHDAARAAHAAYHGGRLVSYVTLGALAGWIGSGVDDLGALAGIGRAAAIATGALMVAWGISSIAATAGVHVPPASPAWTQRALGALLIRTRDASPVQRAGAVGVLTTLLPCGWLYAFVATAGGTGNPLTGAAVMIVFWFGTVPMLLAVGIGARRVFGPLARRLPAMSAAFVVLLGLLAIAGKVSPPALHSSTGHTAVSHAH